MHSKIFSFISILLSINLVFNLNAQKFKPLNYKKFDDKLIHFGFMLGGNSADFNITQNLNAYSLYGVKIIENKRQAGGQLGILTDLKLFTPMLRLRFIPSLSFQERVINYTSTPIDPTSDKDDLNEERINSTNLDFPFLLQFRTLRYNNFTSYIVGGMQYTYDLQSQATSNQSLTDPFVKIKAEDWFGQVGLGVEFFAVYFKCGLEIKYSHGLKNVFIQDYTPISLPIDQIKNKTWYFSIIFEG
jgi:hypothetical protein